MMKPLEIEAKSMEIIGQELKERLGCDPAAIWPEPELAVVKRCIHTSADFDYGDNLVFSKGGVQAGLQLSLIHIFLVIGSCHTCLK